jgi:hypothetical protein
MRNSTERVCRQWHYSGGPLGAGWLDKETMTFLLDRFGEHPQSLGPWLAERGLFHEALSLFSMEAAEERPELFGPWLPVLLHPGPEGNEKRHEERLKKAARLLDFVRLPAVP